MEVVIIKKTKKEKMRLVLISVVLVSMFGVLINSVASDWLEIMNNNHQIKQLTEEYENMLAEEEKLKSDVTKLQDSDYIARYAKEKFLYSQDGDIILRMD